MVGLREFASQFWQGIISTVTLVAVAVAFVMDRDASSQAYADSSLKNHVLEDHSPLYHARYPGDSVHNALTELKDAANTAIEKESEARNKRIEEILNKLEDLIVAVNANTTQTAVLFDRIERLSKGQ